MLLGEVVDELLNQNGLADAGAAEQACLAATDVGLEQVDGLLALLRNVVDAGFVRPELLDALIVVDDVDKLLPALIAWRAGRTKF